MELSFLRGVAVCSWSNVIKDDHIPLSVSLLLKLPHVSASAAKDTILWIVLHSVCMEPFFSGLGFIGFGEGQL